MAKVLPKTIIIQHPGIPNGRRKAVMVQELHTIMPNGMVVHLMTLTESLEEAKEICLRINWTHGNRSEFVEIQDGIDKVKKRKKVGPYTPHPSVVKVSN